MANFLIYGANGYTGSLIAHEAIARNLRPVVAGRNSDAVHTLATKLGLEARIFSVDSSTEIDQYIRDVSLVLHCAGPFAHTFDAMASACLRTGAHYLDITGEAMVFEKLAQRDDEARGVGVMLLPGVGFDVVPSDCLAAHLKRRLPSATHLALGIQSLSRVSRGTATTIVENMPHGGLIRQNGALRRVPAAWKIRSIDFGAGPTKAMTIPWGDVASAFHSTGIPNIEVYLAAPWSNRFAAKASRYLGWLLGSTFVQKRLKKRLATGPPGPNDEQRARGRSLLWGEATDAAGQRVQSWLAGPEGYTLTAQAALAVVERVLGGEAQAGFRTPSRLFGPDFVLGLPGITRRDS